MISLPFPPIFVLLTATTLILPYYFNAYVRMVDLFEIVIRFVDGSESI